MALIPCAKFYEPSYETGKAVRWRIGMPDGGPLAIAGLWRQSTGPDGAKSLAMTMLTVNADEHPLVKRFDRPGAEKRSVVILPRSQYADWLSCSTTEEARTFLRLCPPELMHAESYPLPPRKASSKATEAQQSLLADDGG